jgi:DNA-binding GntR family transcriptional regulator
MLSAPDTRLALQAYEQVLELIMSGRAAPGTLISERRLAETLSMSRTPLRDALVMLEAEGLVLRQGARGVQIRHVAVKDFMDTLQIRLLLEPEAARIACGKIDPAALDEVEARLHELLARGSPAARDEVRGIDDRLHGLICEAAGNAQMAGIIRTLRRQTQIFDLKSLPERFGDSCREHLAIVAALRSGAPEAAEAAMRRHLDCVRASIIAHLARL